MKDEVVIVIAEDDEGHGTLITKNLRRSGITNELVWLKDGQETLDYFFKRGKGPCRTNGVPHLLILDIRMPRVDGVEVLSQMKTDPELRKVPVIVVTTTDDPKEVEMCHKLGCNTYITKPVEYTRFVEAIRQLGLFLTVVQVPRINGELEDE